MNMYKRRSRIRKTQNLLHPAFLLSDGKPAIGLPAASKKQIEMKK